MTFRNRIDAGRSLASRLFPFAGADPLILGVPRGGVVVARAVADALNLPLDVVLVRRLRAPGQPDLAIGAIDEFGHVYLTDLAREFGVPREYLESEKHTQLDAMHATRVRYTPRHAAFDAVGRTVILVDDGIATGATMTAAVRSERLQRAARVIVATPVAPADVVEHLENEADEVIALTMPVPFCSIPVAYAEFTRVTDDVVVEALNRETFKGGRLLAP